MKRTDNERATIGTCNRVPALSELRARGISCSTNAEFLWLCDAYRHAIQSHNRLVQRLNKVDNIYYGYLLIPGEENDYPVEGEE